MGSRVKKDRRAQRNATVFPSRSPHVERITHTEHGRTIRLTRTGAQSLQQVADSTKERFKARFGRDMAAGDPLFWDPNCSEPTPLDEQTAMRQMIESMTRAGFSPAYIHAFSKTGIILTQENHELFDQDTLREFYAAMAEFEQLQP